MQCFLFVGPGPISHQSIILAFVCPSFRNLEDSFKRKMVIPQHLVLDIAGERIFEFFTPAQLGCHKCIFTILWLFVTFITFAFMVGAYPFWILQTPHNRSVEACIQQHWNVTSAYGPSSLLQWISPGRAAWCWQGHPWALEADYLIIWGARWGPLMKRDPYRF